MSLSREKSRRRSWPETPRIRVAQESRVRCLLVKNNLIKYACPQLIPVPCAPRIPALPRPFMQDTQMRRLYEAPAYDPAWPKSHWRASHPAPFALPPLEGEATADIAVIGAGFAG